jgi:NhaP-type Na+/H+ or K+/H+ antiporter
MTYFIVVFSIVVQGLTVGKITKPKKVVEVAEPIGH